MDVAKVKRELQSFIRRHKASFQSMAVRETAMLEMGALVLTSEHYRLAGYSVGIENDKNGFFSVKLSARGNPYNFSWFSHAPGQTQPSKSIPTWPLAVRIRTKQCTWWMSPW